MQLIRPDINIDFMRHRWRGLVFSGLLIAIALISLIAHGGPKYGIDFSGGLLMQVRFEEPTSTAEIKGVLTQKGLPSPLVQHAWEFGEQRGHEYIVRLDLGKGAPEATTQNARQALEGHFGTDSLQVRRVEMVGPRVGEDLRNKGIKSILFALIGILIYISWRFEFKFACGAILALIHDVSITLGAFSVTGKEINLPIVAAFLAIIGYSLNDTIVVYDRIRENLRKFRRQPYVRTINRSVNDTLNRTLLTSGTTLLVVLALFLFGGGVIHDFAFALLVGILAGTYSSIFIASPLVVFWQERLVERPTKKPAKHQA